MKHIFLSPVINPPDTSLWSKIICLWAFQELQPRIKPSHAHLCQEKKKKKGGQWVSHWLLLSQYVTLWWHPLSKASPSTNNVPFSFVTFCLIFSFIWRVIYYTSQKIIFITLKVSQSGPLSCSKTDTVPHVRWRVPLIFQARSNSVSVVCTCPILVIALIQMAPLYATAVPEQFFFFF